MIFFVEFLFCLGSYNTPNHKITSLAVYTIQQAINSQPHLHCVNPMQKGALKDQFLATTNLPSITCYLRGYEVCHK